MQFNPDLELDSDAGELFVHSKEGYMYGVKESIK